MSLKKRNTTGVPTSTKRNPNVRNQYRSRAEREHEVNRLVLIVTGIIALVILVILGGAFLNDAVIQPARSVASINGASISLRDFQQRVTFDRWRDGNELSQIYNNQYLAQQLSDSTSAYGQLYQQMLDPAQYGKRILDQMVNYLVVKQYADANNIKVDAATIQDTLGREFGYDFHPQTSTPTLTPTLTLTPLLTDTPTITPTITPSPSAIPTATATSFPTGIPTVTPGPTEQKVAYDKTQQGVFDAAAKLTGLSTDDIQKLFIEETTEQELIKKVQEVVGGKLTPMQDEVKVRHILVATQDQADAVVKALQNGTSFADLARSVSTDTGSGAQGGELGWAPKGKYVAEFEAYVWDAKTKIGAVSAPIKTQFGYHVIQLEAREQRLLSDQEQQDVQTQKYSTWLTQAKKDKNAQTFDNVWTDNVPTDPSLDKFGVPLTLSNSSGNGLSGLSGLPTQ